MEHNKIEGEKCHSVVWFSGLLKQRYPKTFSAIEIILSKQKINSRLLKGTNDIWCRDYLPVPNRNGGYVQFRFDPVYLRPKKYHNLRTDPCLVNPQLDLAIENSDLILDGGNVIRFGRVVVVTDVVLKDNPYWPSDLIIDEIKSRINVDRVIIIPRQPYDWTGHADGMVRLIDESHILVNDYEQENATFRRKLNKSLDDAGLIQITLPYGADYSNVDSNSASGTYINFLMIDNIILFPEFSLAEDPKARSVINDIYPGHEIFGIDCQSLSKEGGVLHCIGWVQGTELRIQGIKE